MTYKLADRTEAEWYHAIDRHLSSSFSAALCFAPAADWHEDSAFSRFVTGLPNPFGNLIWNAHFGDDEVDCAVKSAIAPIAKRNVPAFWIIGPASEPVNLAEKVISAGFAAGHSMEAMAVDLAEVEDAPLPAGASIEEVCDETALKSWLEVLSVGYELPAQVAASFGYWPRHLGLSSKSHMRAYLARLDGKPVACSMLYLNDGVAGIYCVATIPEARRKGLGRCMTTFPLREARNAGFHVGVLQASAMGASVYRQIGFRTYGSIALLMHSGTGSQVG